MSCLTHKRTQKCRETNQVSAPLVYSQDFAIQWICEKGIWKKTLWLLPVWGNNYKDIVYIYNMIVVIDVMTYCRMRVIIFAPWERTYGRWNTQSWLCCLMLFSCGSSSLLRWTFWQEPADLSKQFPDLAEDFRIPEFFSPDQFFSSVFRISSCGLQLWTHYDVSVLLSAWVMCFVQHKLYFFILKYHVELLHLCKLFTLVGDG